MDTHHVAPHPLPKPRLKRVQRFSHFVLEPGDEELISQLPELHRSMLALSGSYQEIGQKLNLPGGTVRSRLHRARAALVKMREARHS